LYPEKLQKKGDMLKLYTAHIYNEIVSKEKYKDNFLGKYIKPNFDKHTYKKMFPALKDLFTKLNNGTFSQTVIYNYEERNLDSFITSSTDKWLMETLKILGYSVNEVAYQLGYVINNKNKEIPIKQVLDSMKSKKIEQLQEQYEKTKNEAIKKQIDFLTEYSKKFAQQPLTTFNFGDTSKVGRYKIVFSMNFRAVASMSTNVGWTSCMDLEDPGKHTHLVGSTLSAGAFVAWLTKVGDEYELKYPTARVVIKPYEGLSTGAIIWRVDKIYGSASERFRETVEQIIRSVNPIPTDKYEMNKGIYNKDELPDKFTHFATYKDQEDYNSILMSHDEEAKKRIQSMNQAVIDMAYTQFPNFFESLPEETVSKKIRRIMGIKNAGVVELLKFAREEINESNDISLDLANELINHLQSAFSTVKGEIVSFIKDGYIDLNQIDPELIKTGTIEDLTKYLGFSNIPKKVIQNSLRNSPVRMLMMFGNMFDDKAEDVLNTYLNYEVIKSMLMIDYDVFTTLLSMKKLPISFEELIQAASENDAFDVVREIFQYYDDIDSEIPKDILHILVAKQPTGFIKAIDQYKNASFLQKNNLHYFKKIIYEKNKEDKADDMFLYFCNALHSFFPKLCTADLVGDFILRRETSIRTIWDTENIDTNLITQHVKKYGLHEYIPEHYLKTLDEHISLDEISMALQYEHTSIYIRNEIKKKPEVIKNFLEFITSGKGSPNFIIPKTIINTIAQNKSLQNFIIQNIQHPKSLISKYKFEPVLDYIFKDGPSSTPPSKELIECFFDLMLESNSFRISQYFGLSGWLTNFSTQNKTIHIDQEFIDKLVKQPNVAEEIPYLFKIIKTVSPEQMVQFIDVMKDETRYIDRKFITKNPRLFKNKMIDKVMEYAPDSIDNYMCHMNFERFKKYFLKYLKKYENELGEENFELGDYGLQRKIRFMFTGYAESLVSTSHNIPLTLITDPRTKELVFSIFKFYNSKLTKADIEKEWLSIIKSVAAFLVVSKYSSKEIAEDLKSARTEDEYMKIIEQINKRVNLTNDVEKTSKKPKGDVI
jgi:hypothetical protein